LNDKSKNEKRRCRMTGNSDI